MSPFGALPVNADEAEGDAMLDVLEVDEPGIEGADEVVGVDDVFGGGFLDGGAGFGERAQERGGDEPLAKAGGFVPVGDACEGNVHGWGLSGWWLEWGNAFGLSAGDGRQAELSGLVGGSWPLFTGNCRGVESRTFGWGAAALGALLALTHGAAGAGVGQKDVLEGGRGHNYYKDFIKMWRKNKGV